MTDYRMDQTLTLGPVTLTVADLEHSVRYHTQVAGFRLLDRQPQRAQLGVEGQVLVDLHEVTDAVAPPRSVAIRPHAVHVRDSKDTARRGLAVDAEAWTAFVGFAVR